METIFNITSEHILAIEHVLRVSLDTIYSFLYEKNLLRILIPELDYWLFERQRFYILPKFGIFYATINYYRLRAMSIANDTNYTKEEEKAWREYQKQIEKIAKEKKRLAEKRYFYLGVFVFSFVAIFSLALQFNSDFYLTTMDTLANITNINNFLADYSYDLVDDNLSEVSFQDANDYDPALEPEIYDSDPDEPFI